MKSALCISMHVFVFFSVQANQELINHMQQHVQAVVLAAGKSTRFKMPYTKQRALLCGTPIIVRVLKNLKELGIRTTVVLGHQGEEIKRLIEKHGITDCDYVMDAKPLGTGYATLVTRDTWHKDAVMVLNGDAPLFTKDMLLDLYRAYIENSAKLAFAIAQVPDLCRYGRVIKKGGRVHVVEMKDCTEQEAKVPVANAGLYVFDREFLEECLPHIAPSAVSGEYYITELIGAADRASLPIATSVVPYDHTRGVDSLIDLRAAEKTLRAELIDKWTLNGVRFVSPETTIIDDDVTIDFGAEIGAGVHLLGNTHVGKGCKIGAYAILDGVVIDDGICVAPHTVMQK